MNKAIANLLNSKKFIVTEYLIKVARDLNLSLTEFLMLIFFDNSYTKDFDLESICSVLEIDSSLALETFNSLMQKKLISLETVKDLDGRMVEKVSLSGIYTFLEESISDELKTSEKEDIFQVFEKEFGRTLSSMDLEIINGWLSTGTSEEMIIGALKEAVYNGVTNLRYIDKIIYEWGKKGFKSMADVKSHMENRKEEKKEVDLFDYNWLEDDE